MLENMMLMWTIVPKTNAATGLRKLYKEEIRSVDSSQNIRITKLKGSGLIPRPGGVVCMP